MPIIYHNSPSEHRQHVPDLEYPFNCAVARPVDKREMASNPKALAAQKKEWDRLRELKAWDEKSVREWSELKAEANKAGK